MPINENTKVHPVLVVVILAAVCFFFFNRIEHRRDTESWPITDGVIIDGYVNTTFEANNRTLYMAKVNYTYSVDNQSYTALHKTGCNGKSRVTYSDAKADLEKDLLMRKVKVRFDPKAPKKSRITPC